MSAVAEAVPAADGAGPAIVAGIEAGVAMHRLGDLERANAQYLSVLQRDPAA